jgi:hypothetical protein
MKTVRLPCLNCPAHPACDRQASGGLHAPPCNLGPQKYPDSDRCFHGPAVDLAFNFHNKLRFTEWNLDLEDELPDLI